MKRILLLWIIAVGITLQGQTQPKVNTKQLDKYYEQMVKDWGVPSLSIGVVKDGKLVFSGSYGVIEQGKKAKTNANTLYGIASNSKAFTATIIAMLVEEGKLNWNDRVKDYLPYFEVYDPWVSNEITIRDLLSHRVGYGTFSGDLLWYKSDFSTEEIVKRAKYVPQAFSFRNGYGYSNIMYIAVGEVIKAVTGKPWSEVVKERIFEPLGMTRSVTSPKALEEKGNFVTPHARENDKNIPIEWVNWERVGALGGVISSVEDMSKWLMFNLNGGVVGADTILDKQSFNLLWTPHNNFVVNHFSPNNFNSHFSAYGLGWGLSDFHGHLKVSHTGAIDGMITATTLIPNQNLGVVVLTNGMKTPYSAALNYALESFLGKTPRDWSAETLERTNAHQKADTRISSRKESRVANTNPSLPLQDYTGNYKSDILGNINVTLVNNQLRIDFEHSKALSATLKHWHYDVWELEWEYEHAWFSFGTVKFNTDNSLNILGMDFDVPNNDLFFEELKPKKVK